MCATWTYIHKIKKDDPRCPFADTYKSAIATSRLLEIELVEEDRDIDNDLGNVTDRKGDSPGSLQASCKQRRAGEEMKQENLQYDSQSDGSEFQSYPMVNKERLGQKPGRQN